MRPPDAAGFPSRPVIHSSPDGQAVLSQSPTRASPPLARVAAPSGGKEEQEGSGGADHGGTADGEIRRERSRSGQWQVHFSDGTDPGTWSVGRLRFTPASRWMVLLDMENDVLAGKYLPNDARIEVGSRFLIDDYHVVVGHCVQVDQGPETTDLVDLTETTKLGRSGGRFWVLVESDDEEEVEIEVTTRDLPMVSKDTGPERPPEFKPALDRSRSKVQRSEKIVKPWIGPIPKVIYRATAWIRTWSLLTPMDSREPLVTGCNQWEMVARAIFNRFGWRSHNRIGV